QVRRPSGHGRSAGRAVVRTRSLPRSGLRPRRNSPGANPCHTAPRATGPNSVRQTHAGAAFAADEQRLLKTTPNVACVSPPAAFAGGESLPRNASIARTELRATDSFGRGIRCRRTTAAEAAPRGQDGLVAPTRFARGERRHLSDASAPRRQVVDLPSRRFA